MAARPAGATFTARLTGQRHPDIPGATRTPGRTVPGHTTIATRAGDTRRRRTTTGATVTTSATRAARPTDTTGLAISSIGTQRR